MNYHDIKKDDMLNGTGLRVTLFLSGCIHNCKNCHNPQTHDPNGGVYFNKTEQMDKEIIPLLEKDYISGITFSGGDPLHCANLQTVLDMINEIHDLFGDTKTVWLYTGYTWEQIFSEVITDDFDINRLLRQEIVRKCNVIVDGRFVQELASVNYHWAGSTNQRVIDVKRTLEEGEVVVIAESDDTGM